MYPRDYFDTFWRGDLRNEVFVAMSFAEEFGPVWTDAIKPAIEEDNKLGLVAHRVDATALCGSVITEILDGIAHARLVLVELSVCRAGRWTGQRNGNVMYELGLAHPIRQPAELVLLRSDSEPLDFDIAQIRVHHYKPDDLSSARRLVARRIPDALAEIDAVKGLRVDHVASQLDADCLGLAARTGHGPYFHVPHASTMRDVMEQTARGEKNAIARMLELGLLRFDSNFEANLYAYHWTSFGDAVLRRIGVRKRVGSSEGAEH